MHIAAYFCMNCKTFLSIKFYHHNACVISKIRLHTPDNASYGVILNRAIVVVGEGGAGKSDEFIQKAKELRLQGGSAFLCPLENLDGLSFGAALEIGTEQELNAWLEGTTEGWFFLDAADEAKLKYPR